MTNLVVPLVAMAMILAVALLATKVSLMSDSYRLAANAWAKWLPVVASTVFLGMLAIALVCESSSQGGWTGLARLFAPNELLILLLAGALYLSRAGNIVALATLVYTLQKFINSEAQMGQVAGVIFIAVQAIAAVLADKTPWVAAGLPNRAAANIRRALLVILTGGSVAIILGALLKAHDLNHSLGLLFGYSATRSVLVGALLLLLLGWLSIGLPWLRPFTMPLLIIPTILLLAYFTGWPTHVLVLPFAATLALSLATPDRRNRRRPIDSSFSGKLS